MSNPSRIRELTIQYRPHPSGAYADDRRIKDAQDAAAILRPLLEHHPHELCVMLLLDTKHKLLGVHTVAQGGLSEAVVDPKVVFRAALLTNSPAFVLGHNHPSGDPTPSPEDLDLTIRLMAGGKLLGVEMLDHLIIGDGRFISLQETGRIR